jgi:hypothetical protein
LKHAQESLSLINKEKHIAVGAQATAAQISHYQTQVSAPRGQNEQQLQQHLGVAAGNVASASQLPRAKPDARVIVFERKSGKLLAGNSIRLSVEVGSNEHHSRSPVVEISKYVNFLLPSWDRVYTCSVLVHCL